MKYHVVYRITNLLNNRIYVGCHTTNDLNDGYMGSGKVIKRAIKKYGLNNFKKEYLFFCNNIKEMLDKEKGIVTEEFVKSVNTYNITTGGKGTFHYINKNKKNLYGKNGQKGYGGQNLLPGDALKEKLIKDNTFELYKEKVSNGLKKAYMSGKIIPGFLGKKHSDDTKVKLKKIHAMNGHQKGDKNSQYGTKWITNGVENKKINKETLTEWVKQGWKSGRIM